MRVKIRETKRGQGRKTFPTVILSSAAEAQFIHSNDHKQKNRRIQVL